MELISAEVCDEWSEEGVGDDDVKWMRAAHTIRELEAERDALNQDMARLEAENAGLRSDNAEIHATLGRVASERDALKDFAVKVSEAKEYDTENGDFLSNSLKDDADALLKPLEK